MDTHKAPGISQALGGWQFSFPLSLCSLAPACLHLLAQRLVAQVPAPFSRIHSNRSFGPGSSCHSMVTPSFTRTSCNSPGALALLSKHGCLARGIKNSGFSEHPHILREKSLVQHPCTHPGLCACNHRNTTYLFPRGLPAQHWRMVLLEAHVCLKPLRSCPWFSSKHLQLESTCG